MKERNAIFLFLGLIIGLLVMYVILSSSKQKSKTEISHSTLVENIEQIGNLEVVKYNIKDIIEYKKIRQWLPNAKTALVISGEVTICIDLTKVKAHDIYTMGDTIALTLSQPEICHTSINHSQSKIYNMEFGLWESEILVDEAYKRAELYLKEQSLELDYKEKAYENTHSLLTPLLHSMGFKHVIINFKYDDNHF